MNNIKEAFSKVKEDIFNIGNDVYYLKKDLNEIRESQIEVCEFIKDLSLKINKFEAILTQNHENQQIHASTHIPTQNTQNKTVSTHISTDYSHFKPLNAQNLGISSGNRGVPTDRQTIRQTDNQQEITQDLTLSKPISTQIDQNKEIRIQKKDNLKETLEALNKLDSFKKELRLKFKKLTDQEFSVFSKLYELEEEFGYADYKTISRQLNLTESSIRDYIGRIIKKGVPIEKTKINNKMIQLYVASQLKNIVSLQTIINLRDL